VDPSGSRRQKGLAACPTRHGDAERAVSRTVFGARAEKKKGTKKPKEGYKHDEGGLKGGGEGGRSPPYVVVDLLRPAKKKRGMRKGTATNPFRKMQASTSELEKGGSSKTKNKRPGK